MVELVSIIDDLVSTMADLMSIMSDFVSIIGDVFCDSVSIIPDLVSIVADLVSVMADLLMSIMVDLVRSPGCAGSGKDAHQPARPFDKMVCWRVWGESPMIIRVSGVWMWEIMWMLLKRKARCDCRVAIGGATALYLFSVGGHHVR